MRNHQLLSLPSKEGEGAALSLSHGVRRVYRNWGGRPKEIIKYICFAARGDGEKWQSLVSPTDMLHLTY